MMKTAIFRFFLWLDYTANDKWFGGTWETISSRCYRNHKRSKIAKYLMLGLDAIQANHCENAYLNDRCKYPWIPTVPWEVPIHN